MTPILAALTAVCWATNPASLAAALPELFTGPYPLVRGALAGDWAYGYGRAEWHELFAKPVRPLLACGADVLLRTPLAGGDRELFDICGQWQETQWPSRGTAAPVRWQVVGGRLFHARYKSIFELDPRRNEARRRPPPQDPDVGVGSFRLSAESLAVCRIVDNRRTRREVDLQWGAVIRWRLQFRPGPIFSLHVVSRPFRSDPSDQPNPYLLPPADRWRVHYDFVIDQAGKAEVFVLTPGRLTRYLVHQVSDGLAPQLDPTEIGRYVPGWDGPFYVCADGGDRHFVVPGGRMFTLPVDAKPGSALVKTWDADPILALVHDADAGKSYAFTKSHYFNVTAKPDPRPHGLTAFPGATSEEALDTVAMCGRVIRGLK